MYQYIIIVFNFKDEYLWTAYNLLLTTTDNQLTLFTIFTISNEYRDYERESSQDSIDITEI